MPKRMDLPPELREPLRRFLKRGGALMSSRTRERLRAYREELWRRYANVPNGRPVWFASFFRKGRQPAFILEEPCYLNDDFAVIGRTCVVRVVPEKGESLVVGDVLCYTKPPTKVPGLHACCYPREGN